jgi:hypothetical protein
VVRIGRHRAHPPARPLVELEIGLQALPVRVIDTAEQRVVHGELGTDRLGHRRAHAIGADQQPAVLPPGTQIRPHNTPIVVENRCRERTCLAELGSRRHGRVDENLVQQVPSGRVCGALALHRLGAAFQAHVLHLIDGPLQRRTPGAAHRVQHPPPGQQSDARLVNVVSGQCVARKSGAVDEQHPVAGPRIDKGGCGSRDAGTHNDDVVHSRTSSVS